MQVFPIDLLHTFCVIVQNIVSLQPFSRKNLKEKGAKLGNKVR